MNESLQQAIESNNVDKVTSILNLGNINSKIITSNGENLQEEFALFLAVRAGSDAMVDAIIALDPNVNQTLIDGTTALFVAAQEGHVAKAEALLKAGAAPDQSRHNGTTPLYIASQFGHDNIVKLLVDNGADVRLSCDNFTPLTIAINTKHNFCVQHLLAAGAGINAIVPPFIHPTITFDRQIVIGMTINYGVLGHKAIDKKDKRFADAITSFEELQQIVATGKLKFNRESLIMTCDKAPDQPNFNSIKAILQKNTNNLSFHEKDNQNSKLSASKKI